MILHQKKTNLEYLFVHPTVLSRSQISVRFKNDVVMLFIWADTFRSKILAHNRAHRIIYHWATVYFVTYLLAVDLWKSLLYVRATATTTNKVTNKARNKLIHCMLHTFCFWHETESLHGHVRNESKTLTRRHSVQKRMKDKRKEIEKQWHKRRANVVCERYRDEKSTIVRLLATPPRNNKKMVCMVVVYWNGSLSIVLFLTFGFVRVCVCCLWLCARVHLCEWLFQWCMFTCIVFIFC